jgi:hypothetical protein
MHHRLLAAEGSQRAAVFQLYLMTAAFCLIAVSFTRLQGAMAGLFLIAVLALTFRVLWNLDALSLETREPAADELPAGVEKEDEP